MKIKCHEGDYRYLDTEIKYREPDHNKRDDKSAGQPFKTCSYCGSIHPEEFRDYLKNKANEISVSGSDWKYGYPHKFYIDVPNPTPEKDYVVGSVTENGVTTPTIAKVKKCYGKFYTKHLNDIENEELFKELCDLINLHFHIRFSKDEKGIIYTAPHHGYQTWTGRKEDGH